MPSQIKTAPVLNFLQSNLFNIQDYSEIFNGVNKNAPEKFHDESEYLDCDIIDDVISTGINAVYNAVNTFITQENLKEDGVIDTAAYQQTINAFMNHIGRNETCDMPESNNDINSSTKHTNGLSYVDMINQASVCASNGKITILKDVDGEGEYGIYSEDVVDSRGIPSKLYHLDSEAEYNKIMDWNLLDFEHLEIRQILGLVALTDEEMAKAYDFLKENADRPVSDSEIRAAVMSESK